MSKSSVFCIAKSASQAEQIVEDLQSSGFDASEISVLMPDTGGKHDFGHVKARLLSQAWVRSSPRVQSWRR